MVLSKAFNIVKKSVEEDLVYIIGNYGIRIASFIFTILVAKKISPENYGLFGLATLIITYITYFNLGSQYSINKELSINIENSKTNAYALINTIFFTALVIIFVITIKFFGLFPSLRPYLYYLLIYPVFFNILEISNGILRAHNLSKKLGLIKVAGTLVIIVVTVYYYFKGIPDDPTPLFSRFLLFQFVEVAVSIYFLSKIYTFSFSEIKDAFNIKYLKYLVIQGLILSLYITIDSFTKSIDRLFIAAFYSKAELGYYTFGVSLQGPFLLAIGSIMYMDFSRALKRFKSSTLVEFNKGVKHIYGKLFIVWIITFVCAAIFCFFFLKYYLPRYFSSYLVVVIYVFNYFTRILVFPYASYYVSNDLTFDLIKIILTPSIINIALSYMVVFFNLPYIFILIVTLPSNVLYYFIIKNKFEKKHFLFEIVSNINNP